MCKAVNIRPLTGETFLRCALPVLSQRHLSQDDRLTYSRAVHQTGSEIWIQIRRSARKHKPALKVDLMRTEGACRSSCSSSTCWIHLGEELRVETWWIQEEACWTDKVQRSILLLLIELSRFTSAFCPLGSASTESHFSIWSRGNLPQKHEGLQVHLTLRLVFLQKWFTRNVPEGDRTQSGLSLNDNYNKITQKLQTFDRICSEKTRFPP